MSTDASVSLPRQRRIGPGLIVLFAFGVLLVPLLFVAVWTSHTSRRQVADELERIRASGEPLSIQELETFYETPPQGRDTTKIWLTAVAPLYTSQFREDGNGLPFMGEAAEMVPLPGEPWPQLDQAERLLAKYERSLEGMHQAARLGGEARFPFTDGRAISTRHLEQLGAGGQLLALETVVRAHRGHPDDALESVLTTVAAAQSLEREPLLLSQLVRLALVGATCERIVWLLSAEILNDGQLATLDAALPDGEYQKSLRRALVGERTIGMQTFADPSARQQQNLAVRFPLMSNADQTLYLQTMRELILTAEKSGPAWMQGAETARICFRQLTRTIAARQCYPLTFQLVPHLQPHAEFVSRHEAQRDATRVAIAIERFRRQQGRLPESLDELVPQLVVKLPFDQFEGRPLRYLPSATEYVVYSVGPNGADDGGSDESPKHPADIVVRVPLRETVDVPTER